MYWLMTASGVLVLAILFLDVLWTTMGLGGGILTKRLSLRFYSILMRIYNIRGSRVFLSWIPIIILITVVVAWVGMLWVGWTLIFSAEDSAIIQSQSSIPADLWERVYFTGFTIFTLGVGDFKPQGTAYQLLTAFASLTGLFIVTFGVTYLVPVVQAATLKRRMGAIIASLGLSGQDILLNTWNGSDFGILSQYLLSLMPNLSLLEQQHLTYPMLHYFHGRRRSESLALGISALDEALTILRYGLRGSLRLDDGIYVPARQVITQFLYTLKETYLNPLDELPPSPTLEPLRSRGLQTVSDAEFKMHLDRFSERRRLLFAMIRNEGWPLDLMEPAQDPWLPEKPIDRNSERIPPPSEYEEREK